MFTSFARQAFGSKYLLIFRFFPELVVSVGLDRAKIVFDNVQVHCVVKQIIEVGCVVAE